MARILSLTLILALTAAARAQSGSAPIQWLTDPAAAVRQAQQARKPLMVYVKGDSNDDNSDLERDQERSFRNPRVASKARAFVPLKLSRSTHRQNLQEFGFHDRARMEMRFVTPDGAPLGELGATGIAQPDSLAQKLDAALRAYGAHIYDKELKPVFENEQAKPAELQQAVRAVQQLQIRSADKPLIDLLAREGLAPATRKQALEALAALSTKPAVDALLKEAAQDKVAAQALTTCTPVAAEMMLEQLNPEGAFNYTVYKAVTTICRVPQPKPERFFQNSNAKLVGDEVERVSKIVRETATRWKAENE